MTPRRDVMHLLESADVNRYLAAAAERDGFQVVATAFRVWANKDEIEAGRLLARPRSVPGPQETVS